MLNNTIQAEICCGSYYDALQAWEGGADRIELNSALYLGGLTPSLGTLRKVKEKTDLKVICMVRPRGAGFCYEKEDFEIMMEDSEILLENGADGLAFGCLDENSAINIKQTECILKLIKKYQREAVFHRAFDCVKDVDEAINILIGSGVDRVLTSGLEKKAIDGAKVIKYLQDRYGEQIEILAGSGINANNVQELIYKTGIRQVHSSCKNWKMDRTTSGEKMSFAYRTSAMINQKEKCIQNMTDEYEVVDAKLVQILVDKIKTL